MPTAGHLDSWGSVGSVTSVSNTVSVDANDLLLIAYGASSAIVGGPPAGFPSASGLTVNFVRFVSFNSDNALNTKFHRVFFYGMPTTAQTGQVTITTSGAGWTAVSHMIRVQGVLPGANGANAVIQFASANRGNASGTVIPSLAGVQATSSIVGLAARNGGVQWTGVDQPYTTVSGPDNGRLTVFRDDSSFPTVEFLPSGLHASATLLELNPSDTDFWGWADSFGTTDNGWAVIS